MPEAALFPLAVNEALNTILPAVVNPPVATVPQADEAVKTFKPVIVMLNVLPAHPLEGVITICEKAIKDTVNKKEERRSFFIPLNFSKYKIKINLFCWWRVKPTRAK